MGGEGENLQTSVALCPQNPFTGLMFCLQEKHLFFSFFQVSPENTNYSVTLNALGNLLSHSSEESVVNLYPLLPLIKLIVIVIHPR